MKAVQIQNLKHTFPARRHAGLRVALNDISLEVQSGELFGLLGPNGGGKTTLFRILSTLIVPQEGQVQIFGFNVRTQAAEVRRRLGVVFQDPSLDKKLTVFENLLHHGHLYGLRGEGLKARINELLGRFNLLERQNDFVEVLSGGLQRRVEIAKGLLHQPELLLLDEPTTGLDPIARREVWNLILELKRAGMTIIFTTHLLEEGEACDRVAILNLGNIVTLGAPAALRQKIGGDIIQVTSREPQVLAKSIEEKFGTHVVVLDDSVRVERAEGHKFIPQLVEAFPGLVETVKVGKPTLEDVFAKETGQLFSWQARENKKGMKR